MSCGWTPPRPRLTPAHDESVSRTLAHPHRFVLPLCTHYYRRRKCKTYRKLSRKKYCEFSSHLPARQEERERVRKKKNGRTSPLDASRLAALEAQAEGGAAWRPSLPESSITLLITPHEGVPRSRERLSSDSLLSRVYFIIV